MNPSIAEVLNDWANAPGFFSFETRLHPVVEPSQIKDTYPFVNMVFIIDVQGFYLDEEHKNPIKLHRERVISIDRYNKAPEYAEDLKKDIDLFTKESYTQFEKYLSSFPQPIYTSDPKFMK